RRWGREFQVSAGNAFALLAHVGLDCAGAVQLVPDDASFAGASNDSRRRLSERDMADAIAALRTDPTDWRVLAAEGQFSLAGAQPKLAVVRNGDEWIVPGRL